MATIDQVRDYWNRHIHDLEITKHPVGSRGFFDDLDQYHFEKLHHLLRLVPFEGYRGRSVLDVGCGAGVDLVRFAKGGAAVTGVDLSRPAIELAAANFAHQGLTADLRVADGEQLPFADDSFDLVFAHGVVQYTADPRQLVDEVRRVVKPGGEAIFQVYNRISWLNALSKLMKVGLEHQDAP
ncbi:MAG: class I SAM-dependent methyltransferase, partial [Acidobacteria bacterium]|nr:class I SAM-dependent methyltransferase [Acidobacteriota bacterium]